MRKTYKENESRFFNLPLPVKNSYGLNELARDSFDNEMDIIGIIGYTDKDDSPDKRFKLLWEDRKKLNPDYEIAPLLHCKGSNTLTGFVLTKKEDNKKRYFIYGQNGPTSHNGQSVRILRIGTNYFAKPNLSLEEALKESSENGAISLSDPRDFLDIGNSINDFEGVYWHSSLFMPPFRSIQEKSVKKAIFKGKAVVPVSGAHMPYFGGLLEKRLRGIGTSYVEFLEEAPKFQYTSELIEYIKKNLNARNSTSEKNYAPIIQTLKWQFLLNARKILRRKCGDSTQDFIWEEGNPIVKFN